MTDRSRVWIKKFSWTARGKRFEVVPSLSSRQDHYPVPDCDNSAATSKVRNYWFDLPVLGLAGCHAGGNTHCKMKWKSRYVDPASRIDITECHSHLRWLQDYDIPCSPLLGNVTCEKTRPKFLDNKSISQWSNKQKRKQKLYISSDVPHTHIYIYIYLYM